MNLFKYLLIILALSVASASVAHAQSPVAIACNKSTNFSSATITASGSTQLIVAPTATGLFDRIYICSYSVQVIQGATAANFSLISGSGSACATNPVQVTAPYLGTASGQQSIGAIFTSDNLIVLPRRTGLCLSMSAAPVGAVVNVRYVLQ